MEAQKYPSKIYRNITTGIEYKSPFTRRELEKAYDYGAASMKETDKPKAADNVNRPKHYTAHPSGIECWEVTKHLPAELKDVIGYLWRKDLKNGPEDVRKALWYTNEMDAITYLSMLRSRDIYAKNLLNARIVHKHEPYDSLLACSLRVLIAGLEEDANDFINAVHELETKINNQLPIEGETSWQTSSP